MLEKLFFFLSVYLVWGKSYPQRLWITLCIKGVKVPRWLDKYSSQLNCIKKRQFDICI